MPCGPNILGEIFFLKSYFSATIRSTVFILTPLKHIRVRYPKRCATLSYLHHSPPERLRNSARRIFCKFSYWYYFNFFFWFFFPFQCFYVCDKIFLKYNSIIRPNWTPLISPKAKKYFIKLFSCKRSLFYRKQGELLFCKNLV